MQDKRATESREAWLSWAGRRWEMGRGGAIFGVSGSNAPAPRIVTTELAPDAREDSSPRLIQGDALEVAAALAREGCGGRVDVVYVDPPFASRIAYVHEARLDGPADGRVVRAPAYD